MARKNNMSPLDPDRVIALWMNPSLCNDEVCERLNCSFTKVRSAAKRLGLPLARLGCKTGNRPRNPTPDEIAAACREIQSTWTDEERNARAGVSPRLLTFMDPR